MSHAQAAEPPSGVHLLRDPEPEYVARTRRSRQLFEAAKRVLPGGVTGAAKLYEPYPVALASGAGSQVTDVDGNHYVDLLMGAGPLLLGHGHPRVIAAIAEQSARLINPMAPTELDLAYAERLRSHMPYLERLRFANSGSEAMRSALRVARAATGRTRFVKFEGGFHGSDDAFLVSTHTRELKGSDARPMAVLDYSGLSSRVLDEVLVLPYNDVKALDVLEESPEQFAAIVMEPVAFSSGGAVPATVEFARAVRKITSRHNILLIFDEVVCALRMGLAGAPAYLGVAPDLAAIGKAIGGGMPLSAFGGRADVMDSALASDGTPHIFQSGTFTGNPVSLASGIATLDVLESEPILERANATGEAIRDGLRALFAEFELTAAVTGVASIFQVHLGATVVKNRRDVVRADLESTRRFLLGVIAAGVLWPPVHPAVTSGAHTQADVESVLEAAQQVLARYRRSSGAGGDQ